MAEPLIAYVGQGGREITTWHGDVLGPVVKHSAARSGFPDATGRRSYVHSYTAVIDGERWHGRNSGPMMAIRLRRSAGGRMRVAQPRQPGGPRTLSVPPMRSERGRSVHITYIEPSGEIREFDIPEMTLAGATRGGRHPREAIAHYVDQDRMARSLGHARRRPAAKRKRGLIRHRTTRRG